MLSIFRVNNKLNWNFMLALFGFLTFIVYLLTSAGPTPYDYFIRLGDAFLHGKYYLTNNPPWLNELIPIGENKFAVVYPPAPAVIAMPFVAALGPNFNQEYLAWIMGSLTALLWGLIAYKKSQNKTTSMFMFLLAAFGNITWYMSTNGSVWYLGQISAYFFLTLTIYESLFNKNIFWEALFFSFAVLSRLQIILALPLIIYLNRLELKKVKNILIFLFTGIFFGLLYCIYNYIRFGSLTETGYGLIPGVLDEPWFSKGIFSLSYFYDNLRVMFASFPKFLNTFPFIEPSWGGLAIWITSPIFLYALLVNHKIRENIFAWVSTLLIAFVVMCHGTTGFTQFGYRFAVDFYPLIFLLLINSITPKPKWHHWIFLFLSILVNTWGVIWINKLGWVSF